jgi:glycosyltransferase involved in cell wall biosynthesis
MIKVSAIVSVYKAQEFIEGCLQDLVQQSLFKRGQLEIVIIDSNSPQDERVVIERYRKLFPNIVYHRTAERETLYQAWNRGIELASGEYITNANCDDRHHPGGLAALCKVLDNRPEIDLVYADVYESNLPNQPFQENPRECRYSYHDFFAPQVLLFYQFGCQPVWRKKIHSRIGSFSSDLKAAGDWDFCIRFALAGLRALHVPQVLGSFLDRKTSISQQDSTSHDEQVLLKKRYMETDAIVRLYRNAGWKAETPEERARLFTDFSVRASNLSLPWKPGKSYADLWAVVLGFQAAYETDCTDSRTSWNFGIALVECGLADKAKPFLEHGIRSQDPSIIAAWQTAQASNSLNLSYLSL